MTAFNLADQNWIPCIDLHGESVEYGIRDTLLKAHELREVLDDSPLVTVALHRLLLAILYRAFGSYRDFQAWKDLYVSGAFLHDEVTTYLNTWSDRFDLISEHYPFYQMSHLETEGKEVPITRLAAECASGNNATLFDHSGDQEEVHWPGAKAARWLVACQSFALGFGKSESAIINGNKEARPYFADASALRGMNIWLQGDTLFDTLMLNLPYTASDGASSYPWELDDPNQYRDKVNEKSRRTSPSFGEVDCLTWQSRLVRLLPKDGTFSRMFFVQGRAADKSADDPMKTYLLNEKTGRSPLMLDRNKAAWRDVHSILTIPRPGSQQRRPECFNLVVRGRYDGVIPPGKQCVTNIVGLVSDKGKAAKFLFWRHDRLPVPAAILEDDNLIERLGQLIENAENAANELGERARKIAGLYLAPDGRKADRKDIDSVVNAIDPRPAFWARLEEHFSALLHNLPNDWDAENKDWKSENQQMASGEWRKQVLAEARQALEEGIRSLGSTTRAIQAIARVRTDFNSNDLDRKRKGGKNEP